MLIRVTDRTAANVGRETRCGEFSVMFSCFVQKTPPSHVIF
jgi:hypothetical protein